MRGGFYIIVIVSYSSGESVIHHQYRGDIKNTLPSDDKVFVVLDHPFIITTPICPFFTGVLVYITSHFYIILNFRLVVIITKT